MVAVTEQHQSELAQLETLETMLIEMCARLTEIVEATFEDDTVEARETRLQLEAFEERRSRALRSLGDERHGPLPIRIGRLKRLVEALECSWDYFSGVADSARIAEASSRWRMLPE